MMSHQIENIIKVIENIKRNQTNSEAVKYSRNDKFARGFLRRF